jgi:hypothetical protein
MFPQLGSPLIAITPVIGIGHSERHCTPLSCSAVHSCAAWLQSCGSPGWLAAHSCERMLCALLFIVLRLCRPTLRIHSWSLQHLVTAIPFGIGICARTNTKNWKWLIYILMNGLRINFRCAIIYTEFYLKFVKCVEQGTNGNSLEVPYSVSFFTHFEYFAQSPAQIPSVPWGCIHTPLHPIVEKSLFFTKWNLCWAALVHHRLLLKGVLVQDSFMEKAPYFRSLVKIVGQTCLTWNRMVFFYQLLSLTCMWVWIHLFWSTVVCGFVPRAFFRQVQPTSKYFGVTAQISTVTSKHMKLTLYSFYGRRKRTEF